MAMVFYEFHQLFSLSVRGLGVVAPSNSNGLCYLSAVGLGGGSAVLKQH